MKQKLSSLIIIAGALTMVVTGIFNSLPIMLISVIGGFGLSFGYLLFTSVYGGVVWGTKVPKTSSASLKILISIVGLLLGGYALASVVVSIGVYLSQGNLIALLINIVLFLASLAIAPMVGKIFLEKTLAKEKNAMCLEKFPIFKDIEANMAQAQYFVVSFEGVALFSQADYCYGIFLYENYEMGTLTVPEEVALVGSYFVQKYSDKYTFKVDVEVIPGEPGKTVVSVGTGGIGIARIQGTPDKRIFRSYVFTKK